MHIEKSYKYEKNDIVYVSGSVPEDATILETMDILCAEEGFELQRKSDSKNVGNSIWLHDGDAKKNYTEIEVPQENQTDIGE